MTAKPKKRKALKVKDKKSVLPGKRETKNSRKTAKARKPNPIKNNKPFPPGTSGNPKGRPPKLLKAMMDDLRSKGYERVSPSQIKDAFEVIMNLDRKQLLKYAVADNVPVILNVVAYAMLDKQKRVQMLELMLDRAHGKAKQQVGVVHEDNKAPNLADKSFDELYMLKYGKRPE